MRIAVGIWSLLVFCAVFVGCSVSTTADDDDAVGENDLVSAVIDNNLELVSALLDEGMDPDEAHPNLYALASSIGNLRILNQLMSGKQPLSTAIMEESLQAAATAGHLKVVKYWIVREVDPYAKDNQAYESAKVNGHQAVIEYLESIGAKCGRNYKMNLREAATNGHLEEIKMLLESGLIINRQLSIYLIRLAIENRHINVVKYLLEFGEQKWSPKRLLDFKIDAIMHALSRTDVDFMNQLLFKDDGSGEMIMDATSIISIAIFADDLYFLMYLQSRGIDILSEETASSFIIAILTERFQFIEYYIDSGIDLTGRIGKESFKAACNPGNLDILKVLVNRGVNVSLVFEEALTSALVADFNEGVAYLVELCPERGAVADEISLRIKGMGLEDYLGGWRAEQENEAQRLASIWDRIYS